MDVSMSIDKWCAEQCGVETYESAGLLYERTMFDTVHEFEWTIQDPRCREIVRERFSIWTANDNDRWVCVAGIKWVSVAGKGLRGEGKTIAEAEIACITAIYQQLCLDEMTEIAQKTGQYDE